MDVGVAGKFVTQNGEPLNLGEKIDFFPCHYCLNIAV